MSTHDHTFMSALVAVVAFTSLATLNIMAVSLTAPRPSLTCASAMQLVQDNKVRQQQNREEVNA